MSLKVDSNNTYNNVSSVSKKNDDYLGKMLSNVSSAEKSDCADDKNIKRENSIRKIASKFNVSVNDIHDFINKAFGYSKEEFYSLDEQLYSLISNRTIQVVLNIIKSKESKLPISERLSKFAKNINYMMQNGNSIEELTNFIEHFEEKGLFQILKVQFPSELKQYNSAKDVPPATLEGCLQKFFTKFKQYENKDDKKNVGKSLAIFRNLLSRTSADDYKILYNAFIKVVSKEDEKFAALISMIDNFKENPEAFKKFIDEDLQKICAEKGLDYEKVKPIINKIAEVAKSNNIDSVEFLKNLLDLFDNKKMYDKLKQLDENELNDNQKTFMSNYEKYQALKGKNPEDLSIEDKTFLAEIKSKELAIKEGIAAALAAHNQKDAKKIFEVAQDFYGLSMDGVLDKLSDIVREYKIDIDKQFFDEITDGKFSERFEATKKENSQKSEQPDIGLPQRTTIEKMQYSWMRKNDLETALAEANKTNEPEFLVLTSAGKNIRNVVTISIPWQKYQSVKDLTAKDIYEGLTNNYIDIDKVLDNYKDLTHSAKLFVNKLIEIMSPAEQSFRLDGMANSEALDIIRHAHLNPEDLNLALDFASRKELEKMEEERQTASS